MSIPHHEFDEACAAFTRACMIASDWKNQFQGASYTTRLEQAVERMEKECAKMRWIIRCDDA